MIVAGSHAWLHTCPRGRRIGGPPHALRPVSSHVSRTALLILLGCLACAADGAAVDDRYAADPKLRRFVDSMHGETGEPQSGQIVGAAYIDGVVSYGTRARDRIATLVLARGQGAACTRREPALGQR
jgi:hypothetical protein